jgi:hypothetical protein
MGRELWQKHHVTWNIWHVLSLDRNSELASNIVSNIKFIDIGTAIILPSVTTHVLEVSLYPFVISPQHHCSLTALSSCLAFSLHYTELNCLRCTHYFTPIPYCPELTLICSTELNYPLSIACHSSGNFSWLLSDVGFWCNLIRFAKVREAKNKVYWYFEGIRNAHGRGYAPPPPPAYRYNSTINESKDIQERQMTNLQKKSAIVCAQLRFVYLYVTFDRVFFFSFTPVFIILAGKL